MKLKAVFRLILALGVTIMALCFTGKPKTVAQRAVVSVSQQSFVSKTAPAKCEPVTVASAAKVYVCKGAGAKKYHLKDSCRGLSNCKHEVVAMSVGDAENRGLALCGWED